MTFNYFAFFYVICFSLSKVLAREATIKIEAKCSHLWIRGESSSAKHIGASDCRAEISVWRFCITSKDTTPVHYRFCSRLNINLRMREFCWALLYAHVNSKNNQLVNGNDSTTH